MRRAPRRPQLDPTRLFGLVGLGAIVVLAGIGYIAYRANLGLPLQSRFEFYAQVPDADRLISAADVRMGGVLVGEVLSVKAEPSRGGRPPYARLKLAVSRSLGPLPVDSTVQVRPASVLGLTYVDLSRGTSPRHLPSGGTLPLRQALPASDVTDLFQTFNTGAARGFQRATAGLAYGLAGQGAALNDAIGATSRLLGPATEVARRLAAPSTRLAAFLHGYEQLMQALSPVTGPFSQGVADAAVTLGAVAGVRQALAAAIEDAAGAEAATTTAFTDARPALGGLARLAIALRPAGSLLPGSLQQINTTLGAGVAPMRELPAFARPLRIGLRALEGLARDPNTRNSLRKLIDLIAPTNQVLSLFTPAQEDCDVLGLWGVGFSSTFVGQGDGEGPALPNLDITGAGAKGESLQSARPASNLNTNPLPIETKDDCESGNEPYTGAQQLNNLSAGFHSEANRTTTPPPGVTALARNAGLLSPIAGIK